MFDFVEKIDKLLQNNKKSEGRNIATLKFNYRVLNLAKMDNTPLMERLNFLKIINSNIEEFISIRLPESSCQLEMVEIIEELYSEMYVVYKNIIRKLNSYDDLNFIQDYQSQESILYVAVVYNDDSIRLVDPLEDYGDLSETGVIRNLYYLKFIRDKSFEFVESYDTFKTIEEEISEVIKIKEKGSFKYIITNCNNSDLDLISPYINIDKSHFIICNEEMVIIDKIQEALKKLNPDDSLYYKKEKPEYLYFDYENLSVETLIRTPYQSYDHVLDFINQMCDSKNINSIFMTIYRIGKSNDILDALKRASESGKNVVVYIEPTARGDEERNLELIQSLRNTNIQILKKYHNYKVHAKCFCAISNNGKIFTHIGTGNYNVDTSRIYTDMHLITSDYHTGVTVLSLFRLLSGADSCYNTDLFKRFKISPYGTKDEIIKRINEEQYKIDIKCNALCDKAVIDALYDAASRGVMIRLLIRTACTTEHVENIEIRSKVGRYLEHDRIYIFSDIAYISSADLLTRNLSKRVEILYPLKSVYKEKVSDIFNKEWNSETCFEITD